MKIRKNDDVLVMTGKDRGKRGKVHRALPSENRILVEGINISKRHLRPGRQARQVGIIEREAPIHVSNVMLICTKCHQPTRIGFRFLGDRTKVRLCKRCHEVID